MRITEISPTRTLKSVKLAEFDNTLDLSRYVKNAKHTVSESPAQWAGGTRKEYHRRSTLGDEKYMQLADKHIDQFANLALAGYDVDLEYNTQYGVLDYQAAMSGDPCCMFGPTHTETDRSPVHIYVDTWTSCTVKTSAMTKRGVAVLALVRALSVFRPVLVKLTSGMRHKPTGTNAIMTMDVPTTPLDVSIASWVLGSPQPFRCGFLDAIWEVAGSSKFCGIPRLSDANWQQLHMGNYLAKRDGVHDVVHLPFMLDNGRWNSDEYCLSWVKKQLAKYAPN